MDHVRKPSSRTHRNRETPELNLTSLMDIITNLMFFLLMFANIIPVTIINAPLPKIASTAEEIKIAQEKKEDLDLTIRISTSGFAVSASYGGTKSFSRLADGEFPFQDLHAYLVSLHQRSPNTKDLTLIPADDVVYDTIIRTMDASREKVEGDPGYEKIPPEIAQKPEAQQFNRLFPDVSLGGV